MSNWQQLKSMKKNSANQNNPTWWKWGDPKKSFHLNDFPRLKQFLEEKWNKKLIDDFTLPDRTSLIPDSSFTVNDFNSTFPELKPDQFSTDNEDRLRYAFGKSYHDAIRMFSPDEIKTPDFILFPESHEDVAKILKQADKHQISVITFSGGSNVTGAVDVEHKNGLTCSLNMQRMNRLIDIDINSFTATFEAGIFGPQLEKILNEQGFTLGHFPQSFEFSALGSQPFEIRVNFYFRIAKIDTHIHPFKRGLTPHVFCHFTE